ncbi:FapA family protein [Treponema sp. OttesenSCG-928-L16]|nr:FapA family protein [Treponema sp. OttesenSCG-928-L16]
MAAIIAKGEASIVIDSQELNAKLVFTPDEEGLGWDLNAIMKLIADTRLSPPPPPKLIEEFLQKAVRAKEQIERTLYEGIPPEEALPEKIEWACGGIPGDILPFAEESLAKAGKPELYRIRTEKIKKETVVQKQSKLPFLPSKEEIVVSWEKKETREKADADPAVKEKRYVLKNAKAGTVSPQKPGKPGKSVFGSPIAPKNIGDGVFLFGEGLRRDKNEIIAEKSGVIRIGENWADLLPLAKPAWSINTGSDGVTLFFEFEGGDPRFPIPSGKDIIARAIAMGADEANLVSEDAVEQAIRGAAADGAEVRAFPLFQTREAEILLDIRADKLLAVLNLRKGLAGGPPLELKDISQAIKDSGVQGFDGQKVKEDILAFIKGPELELKDYVLAEGRAPGRGKDKELSYPADLLPDEEKTLLLERLESLSPAKLSVPRKDLLPLDEISGLVKVSKEDRIAEIHESSDAEAGMDVFGNVLPPIPGNDPELHLLKGIYQKGNSIIAGRAGLLLLKQGSTVFWGQIIDYREGQVNVKISEDAMEASVSMVRELGPGTPLTGEYIQKALRDAGLVRGIDKNALKHVFHEAMARGSSPFQVIARGELPVPAGGRAVKWLLPPEQLDRLRGSAEPPREGQSIPVEENTVLADIYTAGAEGRPGFDVAGNVLEAGGESASIPEHDASIKEIPTERGCRLAAAHAGELSFDGKKLRVMGSRIIEGDAGEAAGDINFSGDVEISGNVNPGVKVIAGKNILIKGNVKAALVSSGERAVIGGGIQGGGKGIVRAKESIEASLAEEAVLLAVGDIRIQNGCAACSIKTNGRLELNGEKARLAGGICKARLGIDAGNIGSEEGIRTEISFGQDYLVRDQIEACQNDIAKTRLRLGELEKHIAQVGHIPSSLTAARAEKVQLIKRQEQYRLRLFMLQEKFEEHHESEIRVRGTVYPGVVMESHDRYYEVKQKRSRVIFYFDRELGRIHEKPLEQG